VLTDWQREIVERHPADFLRGLFHSDGCRVNTGRPGRTLSVSRRAAVARLDFLIGL